MSVTLQNYSGDKDALRKAVDLRETREADSARWHDLDISNDDAWFGRELAFRRE